MLRKVGITMCYLFGVLALALLANSILRTADASLQKLQVAWFLIAAVCFLLPSSGVLLKSISTLKIGKDSVEVVFAELREKIARLESGTVALSKVHEYLHYSKTIGHEELRALIVDSPASAIASIHATASEFRERTVYRILQSKTESEQDFYRKRFERIVVVLKALTQAKNKDPQNLHNYFAQLAYVHKDKLNRDWKSSYECISNAIRLRDEKDLGNIRLNIYEFNRLLCSVNLPEELRAPVEMESDYQKVHNDIGSRYMLFATDKAIAPSLHEWIARNKRVDLRKWEAGQGKTSRPLSPRKRVAP